MTSGSGGSNWSSGPAGPGLDFPGGLFRSPTSCLFWGPNRLPLNRLLLALSRRVDPGFVWLEVTAASTEAEPGEPSTTGELGSSRFYRVEEAAGISPQVPPADTGELIDREEAAKVRQLFAEFLRLPEPVQELIGRARPGKSPRVLAVANLDRVLARRPEAAGRIEMALAALGLAGVTLIAAACMEPRRDRFDFAHVYRVTTPPGRPWRESQIEAEQGALTDRRLGRFPVRTLVPFADEFASV